MGDTPGQYIIVDGAIVGDGPLLTSADVGSLDINTRVYVLEVVVNTDIDRVRGKIAHPKGWISLRKISTGFQWARKVQCDPNALYDKSLGPCGVSDDIASLRRM